MLEIMLFPDLEERMRVIACTTDPSLIEKMLDHIWGKRYGNFVLYVPRVTLVYYAVGLGPLALLSSASRVPEGLDAIRKSPGYVPIGKTPLMNYWRLLLN